MNATGKCQAVIGECMERKVWGNAQTIPCSSGMPPHTTACGKENFGSVFSE